MNLSSKFLNVKLLILSKVFLFVAIPLVVAAGVGVCFFETTGLTGIVKDKTTGEPIPFANISLEQKGILVTGTTTDTDGKYLIKEIAPGRYDVTVTNIGYKNAVRAGVEIKNGELTTQNFELEQSVEKLSEVIISEKKFEEKRSSASMITKISGKAAAEDPTISYEMTTESYGAADMAIDKSYAGASRKAEKSLAMESSKGARESKAKKMMAEPEMIATAGKLTAGNWCDNQNWDFFTEVLKKSDWKKMKDTWKFDPENRYAVKVRNGKDAALDIPVKLKDRSGKTIWEARTDNKGEAFLFTGLFDKDENAFEIEVGDKTNFVSQTVSRVSDKIIEIDFKADAKPSSVLDVMFMIDATGSMGDELSYIKEELNDVISRVKRTQQQMLTVRVSNNVYRDKGDDYVVRSFPFTENMSVALSQLNEQHAGGGGDYEEAVEAAFHDAINKHEWSKSAAARLMFFVLDAPPHRTNENIKKIQEVTKLAAEKGIRVIPVASSGVDKDTEFLMRFLSVSTGGTYVFLTDHSGIGNSHIEPTIGKYDVEYLNDLLVKVINSYLGESELMTKK